MVYHKKLYTFYTDDDGIVLFERKKEADSVRRQSLAEGANGVSDLFSHDLPWLDRRTVASLKEILYSATKEWDRAAKAAVETGYRQLCKKQSARAARLYYELDGYEKEIQRGRS